MRVKGEERSGYERHESGVESLGERGFIRVLERGEKLRVAIVEVCMFVCEMCV